MKRLNMKNILVLGLFIAIVSACRPAPVAMRDTGAADIPFSLIPRPQKVQAGQGQFTIESNVAVVDATGDPDGALVAAFLAKLLSTGTGQMLPVVEAQAGGPQVPAIVLALERERGSGLDARAVAQKNFSLSGVVLGIGSACDDVVGVGVPVDVADDRQ